MSSNLVRTSSGVWKVVEAKDEPPRAGVTPPMGARTVTPPRGLPATGKDRSTVLLELANADLVKGNLASAETNLRLALTFSPGDPRVISELRAVVEKRDAARRAAGPQMIR